MKVLTYDIERLTVVDGPVDVPAVINGLMDTLSSDDPFYVMNLDGIVQKHLNWIEKMPRVVPHYAVKCNDSELICSTLAKLGAGFDCASMGEICKILKLGVTADRIIFANPMKPIAHLRYADDNNIRTMTFDSEVELQKIKQHYPDAKLVLRIRCDAEKASWLLGKKFGCDPIDEAPRLIRAAYSLGLELVGVSFHVGSGCTDYLAYHRGISFARELFDYAKTFGYDMNLVDIGGGFLGDLGTSIDEVSQIINSALEKFFPDESVRVISEPGRYYVSSAFTLITSVQSKRVCLDHKTGSIDRMMYFLNDGYYASFNAILCECIVPTPKLVGQQGGTLYDSTIWGPSCDSLDRVIESIQLPELTIGDWMVFENMGAYTIPLASPFNGFPLPKIYCYVNKETWEMLNNIR